MTRVVPPVVYIHMFAAVTALIVDTFTLITLIGLPIGIRRIRHGNVRGHAGTMRGIYIGGLVVAGAFTLVPGRLLGNLLWKRCWAC